MPDDPPFAAANSDHVLDDDPAGTGGVRGTDPGATAMGPILSDTVKVCRTGRSATIDLRDERFTGGPAALQTRSAQILRLLDSFGCSRVVIDLTRLAAAPAGLLELLSAIRAQGLEIELLNPAPGIQEALRFAQLDVDLLIRGGT